MKNQLLRFTEDNYNKNLQEFIQLEGPIFIDWLAKNKTLPTNKSMELFEAYINQSMDMAWKFQQHERWAFERECQ